jgi:tRNA uracil 4-sulfurtransferase
MNDRRDMPESIVLRIGELFLKGKNRHQFERTLAQNIGCALRPLGDYEVRVAYGRIFVRGPVTAESLRRMACTFGVASISRSVECPEEPEIIEAVALEMARAAHDGGARSFAVVTRRPKKSFPLRSMEINARVGALIQQATGMKVDLGHPESTIGIEIGHDGSFVYGAKIAGPGGLPVGASGTGLLLLSGGIDSPVAGYLAQKRGLRLQAVYFHSFPYTGDRTREKVVDLTRMLARLQCGMRLWVVPFAFIQEALRDDAPGRQLVLLYRRMMVRIAEALARRDGAECLVTGDSLGQVASQTLANLACIERAVTLPLLRPLVTYDKAETIKLARAIGTFEKSAEPHDDCCSLFVPPFPETKGRADRLDLIESRFPVEAWVDRALGEARPLSFDVEGRDKVPKRKAGA